MMFESLSSGNFVAVLLSLVAVLQIVAIVQGL